MNFPVSDALIRAVKERNALWRYLSKNSPEGYDLDIQELADAYAKAEVAALTKERDALAKALEFYSDGEQLARSFHDLYESLAHEFNYTTREESAVHWDDLPKSNKGLMLAVAARLSDKARQALGGQPERERLDT